jgi:hypothetical protein
MKLEIAPRIVSKNFLRFNVHSEARDQVNAVKFLIERLIIRNQNTVATKISRNYAVTFAVVGLSTFFAENDIVSCRANA